MAHTFENHQWDQAPFTVLDLEEHGHLNDDPNQKAGKNVILISAPTLHAVVNTGAAGNEVTNSLATLLNSNSWIGLVSTASIHGRVDLVSAPTLYAVVNTGAVGIQNSLVTLNSSSSWIGLATTVSGDKVTLGDDMANPSATPVGSHLMAWDGSTWDRARGDATNGLLVNLGSNNDVVLGTGSNYIGLVSTASITGSVGVKRDKTIEILPFAHQASGLATLAVPTGSWFITSLVVNSNATAQFNLLSGATYLTGNASLGVKLAPMGGFVETGAVNSPIYRGLAANQAIVIKSNTTAALVGSIKYYTE